MKRLHRGALVAVSAMSMAVHAAESRLARFERKRALDDVAREIRQGSFPEKIHADETISNKK